MNGEHLKSLGYCRVSNRYRMVSRVDRHDWKEYMAQQHTPWDHELGMQWVEGIGNAAADHYRRCYSKDVLSNIPEKEFKKIPSSSHNPVGFVAFGPDYEII